VQQGLGEAEVLCEALRSANRCEAGPGKGSGSTTTVQQPVWGVDVDRMQGSRCRWGFGDAMQTRGLDDAVWWGFGAERSGEVKSNHPSAST
jgi:hypothetical protein